LISLYPEGKNKEVLKSVLGEYFDALLKYQDPKTGLWKNVIYPVNDYKCNLYETSGSAMISYVLMDSYVKGYVKDKKYAYAGLKAFNGVVKNKLKRNYADNFILSDSYRSSSVSDNVEGYCVCENYVINEAKGIAPLILASSVVEKTFERLYK
jgi:rhamnogalacturonyl hydrolase YesR